MVTAAQLRQQIQRKSAEIPRVDREFSERIKEGMRLNPTAPSSKFDELRNQRQARLNALTDELSSLQNLERQGQEISQQEISRITEQAVQSGARASERSIRDVGRRQNLRFLLQEIRGSLSSENITALEKDIARTGFIRPETSRILRDRGFDVSGIRTEAQYKRQARVQQQPVIESAFVSEPSKSLIIDSSNTIVAGTTGTGGTPILVTKVKDKIIQKSIPIFGTAGLIKKGVDKLFEFETKKLNEPKTSIFFRPGQDIKAQSKEERFLANRITVIDTTTGEARLETKDEFSFRTDPKGITNLYIEGIQRASSFIRGKPYKATNVKLSDLSKKEQIAFNALDAFIKFNLFAPLMMTGGTQRQKTETTQETTKEGSKEVVGARIDRKKAIKAIEESSKELREKLVQKALESNNPTLIKETEALFREALGSSETNKLFRDMIFIPEVPGAVPGTTTPSSFFGWQLAPPTPTQFFTTTALKTPTLTRLPEIATGATFFGDILDSKGKLGLGLGFTMGTTLLGQESVSAVVTDTSPRLDTKQDIKQDQPTITIPKLEQPTTTIPKVISIPKLDQPTIPKLDQPTSGQPTRTQTKTQLVPPKILLGKTKQAKVRLGKSKVSVAGLVAYNALAKRGGKFVKLNKVPLTKARARDLMAYIVDTSLSATGKIQKVSGTAKKSKLGIPKNYYKHSSHKFRDYKKVGKKRIPLKNTYIEKKPYRLDFKNESRSIVAARRSLLGKIKRRRRK